MMDMKIWGGNPFIDTMMHLDNSSLISVNSSLLLFLLLLFHLKISVKTQNQHVNSILFIIHFNTVWYLYSTVFLFSSKKSSTLLILPLVGWLPFIQRLGKE